MNQITPFNFEGNQVRTVLIGNEPYFVGKDVATLLGYKNTKDALSKHVNDKDKLGSQLTTSGQSRSMTVINESGVYDLIFDASRQGKNADIRHKATVFRHWVTNDVLPSIRKNGVYMTDQTAYDITHDKDALGDLLLKAGSQLKQKDLVIRELKPKADYTDSMLANKGLETISMIAKNYGYSTREFNKLLHGLGIQYKQGKTWLLYAKYQDEGYTHVEPYEYTNSDGIKQVRNTMKWTQAGQKFLYDFLKSKGIMPLVEQPA
ncbi:phage antirepressor [Lactiplantibacillus plantarum]|uniref:phage antirepressor n=1 Tax=Lactiplantibacillus plantarum TaxID=1590 RepID=UPI0005FB3884|nr:phage antirepressor KilAC domain-containing protein [Lactiplantibacillus plantarum]MCG0572373.1 antirepressor [Lactiplantibacillus plantarum]MCG0809976.1 antirepressor [Lactiplantibacillus plantarum]UTD41534.1 phage antirepressor KilAC domain-containing protein [Lactiplantibacillus plantarum]